MLDISIVKCIRKYIKEKYVGGGVIKVSDVSDYCGYSHGSIIKALSALEKSQEVKIEKRYSCPEFHYMRDSDFPLCEECGHEYPEELINVYFYFKPLILVKQ